MEETKVPPPPLPAQLPVVPPLLPPKREDKKEEDIGKPDCAICREPAFLPVGTCPRHYSCYKCAWFLCTLSGRSDRNEKSIAFVGHCPICRGNELCVNLHDNKAGTIEGLYYVEDSKLSVLFPEKGYSCPFCSLPPIPILTLMNHVEKCVVRPIRCPRLKCGVDFCISYGWTAHDQKDCKANPCPHCPFWGTRENVAFHERAHSFINKLRDKVYQFIVYLDEYRLHADPLFSQNPGIYTQFLESFLDDFSSRDFFYNLYHPGAEPPADRKMVTQSAPISPSYLDALSAVQDQGQGPPSPDSNRGSPFSNSSPPNLSPPHPSEDDAATATTSLLPSSSSSSSTSTSADSTPPR